jgi:uncharacterized membrane-anchored protein
MHKLSKSVVIAGLLLVLSVFAYSVWAKDQLLKTGEQAFIKLAPVDPRSLIQGDYMVLNYAIPPEVNKMARKQGQGLLVYSRNSTQEITLLRVAGDDETLQQGEKYNQFRYRKRRVQLGANSFFFQEGKAETFEKAKFGEVRIADNGNAILVGLRDESYQLLGMSSGLRDKTQ